MIGIWLINYSSLAALVLTISLGVRHAFGLFLVPMSSDLGWGRETFALAIALQNLVWGLTQPFAGRLADRHGAGWIVFGGAVLMELIHVCCSYGASMAQYRTADQ